MTEQEKRDLDNPIGELADLDKLIHEPRRFAVLNALSRARAGHIGFVYLRRMTGLSQGNLLTHLRKLENANLIEIRKHRILGRSYSRVYITDLGRESLKMHWRKLEDLKNATETWSPSDPDDDDYARLISARDEESRDQH